MDQAELAAWAAASATGLSAFIVLGQAVVQRRQGQLQEAESHRQQAKEWSELAASWETALLVASGSRAVYRFGLPQSRVDAYMEAVERYRLAWISWLEITTASRGTAEEWDDVAREEQAALEQLAPYRRAVEQVVLHLARVSGLVLRRRLALTAPYDAFGLQLIKAGDDLRALLRSGYDHGSGCVAPGNMERTLWQRLNAEQVSTRIGWGEFLDVARGTAERIVLFISLLMVHALSVGDLDGGFDPGHDHESLGDRLIDPERLAVVWRAARLHGWWRAVHLTWKVASAGRRANRRRQWLYPQWFLRLLEKVDLWPHRVDLPFNGWVRRPLDVLLVPRDVARASWHSRSVEDVRRMTPPHIAEERFGLNDEGSAEGYGERDSEGDTVGEPMTASPSA